MSNKQTLLGPLLRHVTFHCIAGCVMVNVTFHCIAGCVTGQFNGFIKKVCTSPLGLERQSCFDSDVNYDVKEVYSDVYLRSFTFVSEPCSSDKGLFYQACGLSDLQLFDDDGRFPCGLICKGYRNSKIIYYHLKIDNPIFAKLVETSGICKTSARDMFLRNRMHVENTNNSACDGYCTDHRKIGVPLCIRESYCHGVKHGIYCDMNTKYISNVLFCDGFYDCEDGRDESNCKNTANHSTCNKFSPYKNKTEIVPIFEFNRCGPIAIIFIDPVLTTMLWPYCAGFRDQTNCSSSDKIGLRCEIDGFMSSVSDIVICNKFLKIVDPICDNGLDQLCVALSESCFVHKHQMCDGWNNCDSGTDEVNHLCSKMYMVQIGCKRLRFRKSTDEIVNIPTTPVSWIDDGVVDCEDAVDEVSVIPMCGFQNTIRRFMKTGYLTNGSHFCPEVYLCSEGFVRYVDLCDRIDSCGNENGVCEQSRGQGQLFTTPIKQNGIEHLMYCLPGMNSLIKEHLDARCKTSLFGWPNKNLAMRTFKPSVSSPQIPLDCQYFFGKIFVYLSCLGLCKDAQCPLRVIKYNSCNGKYLDRVYTISDSSSLTFLIPKMEKGIVKYRQNVYPCINGQCVEYDKVCNLANDCGDFSDERFCDNYFKCNSSMDFIFWSKHCDGNYDCPDLSDECNEYCNSQLIPSTIIKAVAWIIGMSSLVLNITTLPKHVLHFCRAKMLRSALNFFFLIFINIGDLLVAVYIQTVVIFDVLYGRWYCSKQFDWLTGPECSAIGIMSTFGTLVSALMMTFLSMSRFFVIKRGLSSLHKTKVNRKHISKMSLAAFAIIGVSFCIATMPIIGRFDNFFVNGVVYDRNPLFIGAFKKRTLLKIIKEYYGRIRYTFLPWNMIISMVADMFSKDYKIVLPKKIQFYGNDAVCQFKYFVTTKDPQRNYVWFVIGVHSCSLLIITICYIGIWKVSKNSTLNVAEKSQMYEIKQRNMVLHRKIMAIIGTDSLCFLPFFMLTIVHSTGVLDATSLYPIISLVVIPINSMINPIILNDTVSSIIVDTIKSVISVCKNWLTKNIANNNITAGFGSNRANDFQSEMQSVNVPNL